MISWLVYFHGVTKKHVIIFIVEADPLEKISENKYSCYTDTTLDT